MICSQCQRGATPYPHENSRVCAECYNENVFASLVDRGEGGLWWLSFADGGLPSGRQFLGVAIIEAPSHGAAVMESHRLGCNPGGEIQVIALEPSSHPAVLALPRGRLLSRDDLKAAGAID